MDSLKHQHPKAGILNNFFLSHAMSYDPDTDDFPPLVSLNHPAEPETHKSTAYWACPLRYSKSTNADRVEAPTRHI